MQKKRKGRQWWLKINLYVVKPIPNNSYVRWGVSPLLLAFIYLLIHLTDLKVEMLKIATQIAFQNISFKKNFLKKSCEGVLYAEGGITEFFKIHKHIPRLPTKPFAIH